MSNKSAPSKIEEVIDNFTIKYHTNSSTQWLKGKIVDGKTQGYWERYRLDGTLKRSGYFNNGVPVEDWTAYDKEGKVYKLESNKSQ